MDNKTLVAIVDSLIDDAIKNIQLIEGPQGPKGLKGRDGNDFELSEHQDKIIELIESHSNISLSVEQIESLQGRDGKDGRDGRDGESIFLEDILEGVSPIISEKILEMREELKLRFSDLTEEELTSIRGSRGQRGKPGKDFTFEENLENITKTISKYISSIENRLKLKFEDLSEEEIESLRGPSGFRGKDGDNFVYEDHEEDIRNKIITHIGTLKDTLKLKFEDLSDEEKNVLKLKFDDLSDEEVFKLRGSRGQRGKPGADGDDGKSAYELSKFEGTQEEWLRSLKGERGERGIQGLPGLTGLSGPRGIGTQGPRGEDGKDAPYVEEITLVKDKNSIAIEFDFSDGSQITTNEIKFPKPIIQNFYTGGMGGSSCGEGASFKNILLATDYTADFPVASIIFDDTSILHSNVCVPCSPCDEPPVSPTISPETGITIPGVLCDSSVYVGAAIYVDAGGTAYNALADNIATSNVLGIVESKESSVSCTVRVLGVSTGIYVGLDVTESYFLSDITPGLITTTAIADITGHVILRLGQPFSSTRFLVNKGVAYLKA